MGLQYAIIRKLPLGIQEYPMDATFAVLCVASGVVSLLGAGATHYLPRWGELAWSVALLVGSIAWLAGILSARHNGHNIVILVRVPILVFGLGLVSSAALAYAIALVPIAGWAGLAGVVPLLTFAVGTNIRRVLMLHKIRGSDGGNE